MRCRPDGKVSGLLRNRPLDISRGESGKSRSAHKLGSDSRSSDLLITNTSIKSFSFLCWTLRIVRQKVSTKSLMAASSDCFPSSSCLLLHEYWNFVPNNNNIPVKETKIWLPFKTWCSLSLKLLMPVLRCPNTRRLMSVVLFTAHSPDNLFLGFVVSAPVPVDAQPLRKKPVGLVYGKDVEFWQVRLHHQCPIQAV